MKMQKIELIGNSDLDAGRELRGERLTEFVLSSIINKVDEKSKLFNELLECKDSQKNKDKAIRRVIANEIAKAVDGRMTVTEYLQEAKSNQTVYLFLGTHWEVLPSQMYKDFIKDAAIKMGTPDEFWDENEFMNKLFELFAYKVSHHRTHRVPTGKVWINVKNGTLEVSEDGNFEFREHRKEDFFTYVLPYNYNKEAECPIWHTFLDRVMPEKQMQTLLGEYIGYCFTQNIKLEKMAVFYGTGANGKSVTLEVVEKLFGRSNVANVSLSDLTINDEKRSLIENKLANISSESGGKIDAAYLKQISSGEPVPVRKLYLGTHIMYNYAKLFTSFNTLPKCEQTHGFYRRWILFPFSVTIPDSEQDIYLGQKLAKELPGILNWVLAHIKQFVMNGTFTNSPLCEEALRKYKNESTSASVFFYSMCELSDSQETQLSVLYKRYVDFCTEEGYKDVYGKKKFQEVLKLCKAEEKKDRKGYKTYNVIVKNYE